MNAENRLLAIGDIHGCIEKLEWLIAKVELREDDTIIFLGDYINRGSNSSGVIEYLLKLKEKYRSIFLMGNHEIMFLDYLRNGNSAFLLNGGSITIRSYVKNNNFHVPSCHLEFYEELRPFFVTEKFIFVHAGLRPGIPLVNQDWKDLLWIRDEFLLTDYDWGKTIVYGHNVNKKPILLKNRIGLDTGCVYREDEGFGKLTCCDVISRIVWSV